MGRGRTEVMNKSEEERGVTKKKKKCVGWLVVFCKDGRSHSYVPQRRSSLRLKVRDGKIYRPAGFSIRDDPAPQRHVTMSEDIFSHQN